MVEEKTSLLLLLLIVQSAFRRLLDLLVALVNFGVPRTPTISYCGFRFAPLCAVGFSEPTPPVIQALVPTVGVLRWVPHWYVRSFFHLGHSSIFGVVSTSGSLLVAVVSCG
jgi:hypothetical protein